MPKFRKVAVVVEAVQITRPMAVKTLEGVSNGNPGDWLITGVEGRQYFCKDSIFQKTYTAEDGDNSAEIAMESARQRAGTWGNEEVTWESSSIKGED